MGKATTFDCHLLLFLARCRENGNFSYCGKNAEKVYEKEKAMY